MVLRGTYDTIKQAIQDVIAPQLQELKGDMAGLRGEIGGLRGEMRQMEKRVDERMGSLEKRLGEGLGGLEKRMGEGLGGLERRMGEGLGGLEKRMEEGFAAVRVEIAHTHRRLDDVLDIRERLAALEARFAPRS